MEEIDSAFEHPDRAASWSTETWQSMDGCYDSKCDRCRTGLVYRRKADGRVVGKVKESTRIRTTSSHLAKEMDLPCRCPTGKHVMMVGQSGALEEDAELRNRLCEKRGSWNLQGHEAELDQERMTSWFKRYVKPRWVRR